MAPVPPLSLLTWLLSEPPDLDILTDSRSWMIVKDNAPRHGVAPLIASVARPYVDKAERVWCDQALMSSWTRHTRNVQQLDEILPVLDKAGIPVLLLKGPALACRYYRPAFLRKPSSDLDLAVRKDDLDRAVEALAQTGYEAEDGRRERMAISHHVRLIHTSRPTLELHFRLTHK